MSKLTTTRSKFMAGVAMAAALTLSACGLDDGGSKPSAEGSDAAAAFTIYTARDKALAEGVVADFEAANPAYKGKVTILTLGAQEALERIRGEKSNPQGDVWWGGTSQQMTQAANDDLLDKAPTAVVDAIPAEARHPEGLWVGEMKLAELFMINTDMMPLDQAPSDWDDLLKPEYKDKIAIRDVEPSGTMRSIYSAMIQNKVASGENVEAGYTWLKSLDANTKVYAANPTDLYQRMSRQEAPISLWNLQDIMLQKSGSFKMLSPKVPTSGAPMLIDGVAKVKGGPNGAGADAFLSFLLSNEEQAKLAEKHFQIPTVKLKSEPSWLAELNLKEMKLDWNAIASNETEWISYWASNIKNKG
ncbi:extracellular solute-binding protein [Galactobacter valiniphilus]|uniref:Extracellular solute-binding protein n=1 Tax=Galactobacter valiniphilus TaxID=2676122 RepID=A0A399JH21_9MICC|nr:extracellular solute-binding protein [Galactobacter valiniphilus]RII43529.1 extracellular solute-binding protein [Galactobacter valiniphilus]